MSEINIIPLESGTMRSMPENLIFGRTFSNRMFIQRYHDGKGWHDARIDRYQPIALEPAASVFHYGQECFEGTKAYRRPDGNINLFRTMENMRRFNRSAARLSMPQVDPEFHLEAIMKLVEIEQEWVPDAPGSLYIRPTLIASAAQLGLAASAEYIHFVILGPVANYFAQGFSALPVWIEREHVRASPGGTGDVKVGGNYAAAVLISEAAKQRGYAQVLWLDALEHRYVEEVGAMNIAFVYGGNHIVTPELSGTILPGITRDSVIKLAPDLGYSVEETRIDVHDLIRDIQSGEVTEAFGMGTAAVIAPVGAFGLGDDHYQVGDGEMGSVAKDLYDTLTGIQFGTIDDPYNWTYMIELNGS